MAPRKNYESEFTCLLARVAARQQLRQYDCPNSQIKSFDLFPHRLRFVWRFRYGSELREAQNQISARFSH